MRKENETPFENDRAWNSLSKRGKLFMSLRRKIMLAVILLVFIPVTVMSVFTYVMFSNTIESKTEEFYATSLLETDRKIEYVLKEINGVSDLSITQPLVQQFLKRRSRLGETASGGGERQLLTDLNNLLMAHPKITSLSLYDREGLVHSTGPLPSIPLGVLEQQSWYPRMKGLLGRPLWLGPFENRTLPERPLLLTHVRTVKDYYSLEDIGTLLLTVKTDVLDHILWEASTLEKGDILLVNQDGIVIFNKSGERLGQQADFPFLHQDEQVHHSYRDRVNGENTFVTYLPSHIEGWYLVALTPLKELRAESQSIRNIAFGLFVLTILSALLFDVMFVSRVVSAIISVVQAMKKAELGRFGEIHATSSITHDESHLLVRGFNRMIRQIQELIRRVEEEQQRKKQAEMQALVAQINPHFIYNSLESINSMAVLQGNREISRMVISLGKLLRISISETQELVPIATEFEHVKHYLLIQKFRFEDKIEYELDLPSELKPYLALKLIVQPIVENALYHGIEQMKEKGIITIRAFAEQGDLIIVVQDNGLGMNDERLAELFADNPASKRGKREQGVGLRNVHERIRIRFGSPYGILISSVSGEGTIVRIRLPLILHEDKGGDSI